MKHIPILLTVAVLCSTTAVLSMQKNIVVANNNNEKLDACFICYDTSSFSLDVLCNCQTGKNFFIHPGCLTEWEYKNGIPFSPTGACPYCCEKIKKNTLFPYYEKCLTHLLEKKQQTITDYDVRKKKILTQTFFEKVHKTIQQKYGTATTMKKAEDLKLKINKLCRQIIKHLVNKSHQEKEKKLYIQYCRNRAHIITSTLSFPLIFLVTFYGMLYYLNHTFHSPDSNFPTLEISITTATILGFILAKKIGLDVSNYFYPNKDQAF